MRKQLPINITLVEVIYGFSLESVLTNAGNKILAFLNDEGIFYQNGMVYNMGLDESETHALDHSSSCCQRPLELSRFFPSGFDEVVDGAKGRITGIHMHFFPGPFYEFFKFTVN